MKGKCDTENPPPHSALSRQGRRFPESPPLAGGERGRVITICNYISLSIVLPSIEGTGLV